MRRARKALGLMRNDCLHLHHDILHRHDYADAICPVEQFIESVMEDLDRGIALMVPEKIEEK